MAHCTHRGAIGEFGPHGPWSRRRRHSQGTIARQILKQLGLSRAEITKPRCCLLNGHPIWKAVREVRGKTRQGTPARQHGLENVIARYPETHLRVADIEYHLRYHHVQPPNTAKIGKRNAWRVGQALESLKPREKELLFYLAQVELMGIRQWVDIWGTNNYQASKQVAGRLLGKLTDREILFEVKRPARHNDVTTRAIYYLSPLGKACVEALVAKGIEDAGLDAGDGNVPPLNAVHMTEVYKREQVDMNHLPHNISMVEALSKLYSDANGRALPMLARIRGEETAVQPLHAPGEPPWHEAAAHRLQGAGALHRG